MRRSRYVSETSDKRIDRSLDDIERRIHMPSPSSIVAVFMKIYAKSTCDKRRRSVDLDDVWHITWRRHIRSPWWMHDNAIARIIVRVQRELLALWYGEMKR